MHHNLTIGVTSMAKNHQWNMMKLKLLVQGLNLIKTFCRLANTLLSCNHISNTPIEVYITCLIFSQNNYSIIYSLLICIDHQSHCYSEINPERDWNYCETSSDINNYCGPKQRSYYQPASYNES